MARTVKEALDFLSKNDQGMFLVYEQGDVSYLHSSLNFNDDVAFQLLYEHALLQTLLQLTAYFCPVYCILFC